MPASRYSLRLGISTTRTVGKYETRRRALTAAADDDDDEDDEDDEDDDSEEGPSPPCCHNKFPVVAQTCPKPAAFSSDRPMEGSLRDRTGRPLPSFSSIPSLYMKSCGASRFTFKPTCRRHCCFRDIPGDVRGPRLIPKRTRGSLFQCQGRSLPVCCQRDLFSTSSVEVKCCNVVFFPLIRPPFSSLFFYLTHTHNNSTHSHATTSNTQQQQATTPQIHAGVASPGS